MAKLLERPTVELRVALILSEEEARALDALVGYGDDAFIKVFYEHLGKAYMEKHEEGLRALFQSVRDFLPGILERTTRARATFNGPK